WFEIYAKPTGITTSAKLLPEVDNWLARFLTPPVLSMQRAEIDLDDFPVTNIDEIVDLLTLSIKEI
ncbi:10017_t:CDS:2, partial [Gigaspora margarita]